MDLLTAIPGERDFEAVSLLARAYNNPGLYEEALSQLENIAEAGKQDSLWHFRAGYSLYHLKRYEEAAQAFRKSEGLKRSFAPRQPEWNKLSRKSAPYAHELWKKKAIFFPCG